MLVRTRKCVSGKCSSVRTKSFSVRNGLSIFRLKRTGEPIHKLEWIEKGLQDLVWVIREKNIRSIAVPPLGCGNGGLDWDDVRPLVVAALEKVEGLEAVGL